jgi:hypothetical protein
LKEESQPRVLLCATMWWTASARLATAFLRHGCRVSAVCPPGHPLRFVTGIESIYPYKLLNSVGSLKAAIHAARPSLIVPCDDGAVWQLHELHTNEAELRPLIEHSLGAKEAYPTIQRRADVLQTAVELGIRVPFTQTVNSVEDLKGWCLDAPAVLKIDGTWGGEGVTIVRSQSEAIGGFRSAFGVTKACIAWKRFLINRHPLALWSWRRRKSSSITIQEFIPGRPATTMFACWQGEVLASVTVEVLASRGAIGAATIVRLVQNEEIDSASRLLARKFMLSGFHGLDFILEEGTGAAYMLELNPRATQLGHLNLPSQGDLAGVLAAKLSNEPVCPPAPEDCIPGNTIAFFPQALNWNLKSVYLRDAYHDIPWEEPALVQELMRVSWPDRQVLNLIFLNFRASRRSGNKDDAFTPIEMKLRSLRKSL